MTEVKKDKVVTKNKATAKTGTSTKVRTIRLYNNMRAPFIVPYMLANSAAIVAKGEGAVTPGLLFSMKNVLRPGESILLDKDIFENFLENKQTHVVHTALKYYLDKRNLIVADVKEAVDLRDPVDVDAKRKPTSLVDASGKPQEVLLCEPMTLQLRKSHTVEVPVK